TSWFAYHRWFFPSTALRPLSSAISPVIGSRLTMSSDQNFLPAASSSPLAHMSVKAFASSCVFMTSNPFLLTPLRGSQGDGPWWPATRLMHWRRRMPGIEIAFASFHHKWFTADWIARDWFQLNPANGLNDGADGIVEVGGDRWS